MNLLKEPRQFSGTEGLLASRIIGGLAGWLVQYITKDDAPFGIIRNILLGVIGGTEGGFVFNLMDLTARKLIGQLVVSVVGAVIFLYVIRRL